METAIENKNYELEILKNLAYSFYPKGICSIKQLPKYKSTPQFKLLDEIIQKHKAKPLLPFIKDFKQLPTNKIASDVTRFSWKDRAYNFQLIEVKEKFLISICLNISILIPYYTIYVVRVELKENTQEWLTLPNKLNSFEEQIHKNDIDLIEDLVEKKLNLKKLPISAFSTHIEDINFQDQRMGDFSIFNAFFLNDFFIQ